MSLHGLLSVTIGVPNVDETAAYYTDFGLTPGEGGWFSTADAGPQLRLLPAPVRSLLELRVGADDPDATIPTQEPGGLFTGLSLPGVADTSTNAPGRNLAIHATYLIHPTLVNDAGYAFSWGAVLSNPVGLLSTSKSPDINPTLLFNTGVPRVPSIDFCAFTAVVCGLDNNLGAMTGFGPYRDYNKNHNNFDNLTWPCTHVRLSKML